MLYFRFMPENFKGIWKLDKILVYIIIIQKSLSEFDKAKKMFAFLVYCLILQLKLQLQNINSRIEDTRILCWSKQQRYRMILRIVYLLR